MEKLKDIDTQLFLLLNGWHNSFFDEIMYYASSKLFWIPFYLLIFYFLVKRYKWHSSIILVFIAITITLCDQIASGLIKESIQRLRPCHDPLISSLVHLSRAGCGGKYGFVSSHAANTFGLATFLTFLLPPSFNKLKITLFLWAILVSYSRIYVGVHYPSDVLVASLLGIAIGWMVVKSYKKTIPYFTRISTKQNKNNL